MRPGRKNLLIGLALLAVGCGDAQYRDLKSQWREANAAGTQDSYLAYMAAQGFARQLAHPVDEPELFKEYFERRDTARSHIFEIGLQSARDTCPFSKLYVDLRQNVHYLDRGRADLAGWYATPFRYLGIEFVEHESEADAVLEFVLTGHAVSQTYSSDASRTNARRFVTGGLVNGSLAIRGHSSEPVVYKGHAPPEDYVFVDPNWTGPKSDAEPDVPSGIRKALSNADFRSKLSELIYEVCSPGAGVFLSFYDNISAIDDPEQQPASTEAFREKMLADIDQTLAMLVAAATGVPHDNYIYESSSAAIELLAKAGPVVDRDLIWKATRGKERAPPWSEVPPMGETL